MRTTATCLVLGLMIFTLTPAPPAKAGCKTLSYGYVGYTENGTRTFVKKQLDRKIAAWKDKHGARSARVGKTQVSCKIFLKIGFFTEHECHAKASVCR